jgi:magnesium chelatase subunit I
VVPGPDLVQQTGLAGRNDPARLVAASELVLEGLVAQKRISRSDELGYARARPEKRGPGTGAGGIDFLV